ncbi:hypothetical protein CDFC105_93861 [Clostridioides difficile]|nr:hypothetical protein CDFC105_93861 [Clostridioides difficile]
MYLNLFFFFQAEDGIRDFCLSRGLGDVYKRQILSIRNISKTYCGNIPFKALDKVCLLYTSDAADEEDSVDLGGRRIIKKKKKGEYRGTPKYMRETQERNSRREKGETLRQ